jgi:hypothetical protein
LDELNDLAKKGNRVEPLIKVKIIYSWLYVIKGNQNEVVSNLIITIELASEENLISYFLSIRP